MECNTQGLRLWDCPQCYSVPCNCFYALEVCCRYGVTCCTDGVSHPFQLPYNHVLAALTEDGTDVDLTGSIGNGAGLTGRLITGRNFTIDTAASAQPFNWMWQLQTLSWIGSTGGRLAHLPADASLRLLATRLPPCTEELDHQVRAMVLSFIDFLCNFP